MTDKDYARRYAEAECILNKSGPEAIAKYLFGPSGEAQSFDDRLRLGYWNGNHDAKVFVVRGHYLRYPNRFTDQERWMYCVEEALRAQAKDGK